MKNNNKLLIFILLLSILITGCNSKNNLEETINNDANEPYNENVVLEKKGHTLNSTVGTFIVDKDGSVYYKPYETIKYMGVNYNLTTNDLSILGTKQKYTNYTYQNEPPCDVKEGCTVEAYKLDLTNISSAYEVEIGNGGVVIEIIFLSYDGEVHELSFNFSETNKIK